MTGKGDKLKFSLEQAIKSHRGSSYTDCTILAPIKMTGYIKKGKASKLIVLLV
jgi:hypothetical protein